MIVWIKIRYGYRAPTWRWISYCLRMRIAAYTASLPGKNKYFLPLSLLSLSPVEFSRPLRPPVPLPGALVRHELSNPRCESRRLHRYAPGKGENYTDRRATNPLAHIGFNQNPSYLAPELTTRASLVCLPPPPPPTPPAPGAS